MNMTLAMEFVAVLEKLKAKMLRNTCALRLTANPYDDMNNLKK